jgi:hypothetical protein
VVPSRWQATVHPRRRKELRGVVAVVAARVGGQGAARGLNKSASLDARSSSWIVSTHACPRMSGVRGVACVPSDADQDR